MAAPLTDLLSQAEAAPPSDSPNHTQTLTDTLRKHARQLTDADLLVLVAGLREQRTRWNAAQAAGSRERISSQRVSREATALPPQAPTGFKIKVRPKPVL